MSTARQVTATEKKARLSATWLFVLLNLIFRDIHDLFRPGLLQEMMTGVVNDVHVTEHTLLLAGVALEIPIAMVLLCWVLANRANRWANIVAGLVTIPLLLVNAPKDLDDVWFLAISVIALSLVVWHAWTWRAVDLSPTRAEV